MPAQRPNVIVFQEFQGNEVAPDIAELNALIAGPCYQLLDFLDDQEDCYADDYGELDAAIGSGGAVPIPDSMLISSPPNIKPGAILDEESVKIFLDDARVVLASHDDTGGAAPDSAYVTGDNLFKAWDAGSPPGGAHFEQLGVQAGDTLIALPGTGSDDYVLVVKELCQTLYDTGSAMDFSASGVVAGDTLEIFEDEAATTPTRIGTFTVKRIVDAHTIEVVESGWPGAAADAYLRITGPTGTVKIDTEAGIGVGSAGKVALTDWCHLRTTKDFTGDSPVADGYWRIERDVATSQELDSTEFEISGNQITIDPDDTGIELAITVAGALASLPVTYAKLYVEYAALRQDLQLVTEISETRQFEELLGKYDARNPLRVAATIAAANTTTPIYVYGVKSNDLAGYQDMRDRLSSNEEIYAIVPLTYSSTVLAMLGNMATSLADPNYALDNGIKQKFRAILGAVELTTEKEIVTEMSGGTSGQLGLAPTLGLRTLQITANVGTIDLIADKVLPGDTIDILYKGSDEGTFTIAHVNSALELEVASNGTSTTTPELPALAASGQLADELVIKRGTTVIATYTWATGSLEFDLVSANIDALYRELTVPTATFVSAGVIPGDTLEIPLDPESDDWTNTVEYTIDTVESETRIRIVDNGTNDPTVTNELPHGVKRVLSGDPLAGDLITAGELRLRVKRSLGLSDQASYLVDIAESYANKRIVLCFPDEVDVADLVDGSKERYGATDPVAADPQPGYYLAAMLAGQTAGQPSQQGFTNLGGAGITELYNTRGYFPEEQLTVISNGGVNVYVQDNPDALPYSIHSLTTDVTALETGEYMTLKNYDFVAKTYLDTLIGFLGVWNITTETIGFIREALNATTDVLEGRYVAKIGAPLRRGVVQGVEENESFSDRLEAYINVDLPKVLNTVALHLVA